MNTDRKTLHRLIDLLPESSMDEVEHYLSAHLSDSAVPLHDMQEEAGGCSVDESWLKMDFLQTEEDAQKQFCCI